MRSITTCLFMSMIVWYTSGHRLPEMYESIKYHVHLQFLQDLFVNNNNDFNGTAKILLKLTRATDYVELHTNDDFIKITDVTFNGVDLPSSYYITNSTTETLRIKVPYPLETFLHHEIVIQYNGFVNSYGLMGLYKSSYVVNGTRHYVVATQFQPYYARRAFPCFDEPGFKAEFSIAITAPLDKLVLSNSPISSKENISEELQTVQFASTPKMPTYTIAFSITDFNCTKDDAETTLSVCSTTTTAGSRDFAMQLGQRVLKYYGNLTGIDYSSMTEKMDAAALPDSFSNGMESWGMVTFRETDLLFDQNRSSNSNQQRIAFTMVHEFSHQWFGNLVTMKWWSELYLSEGFGRYFEYFATNELFPEWQTDKQFVVEQLHDALEDDAFETTVTLRSSCETSDEINAKFGFVSYAKGASVLRMMRYFLGTRHFIEGLESYLKKHQYSSVESSDLLEELNSKMDTTYSIPPANVETIMENWLSESGYPIIDVKLSGKSVEISQVHPISTGVKSEVKWYVPITYTTSIDSNKFSTEPRFWLSPNDESAVLATLLYDDSWIILNNNQIGYYRVNYDNTLWNRISNALSKDNFDGIIDVNRAQIIDDLFALAKYRKISYARVLNTIQFLKKDTSYFSWYAAIKGINFILSYIGEDTDLGKEFQLVCLSLVDHVYKSLSFDPKEEEDHISSLKRDLIFSFACKLGNTDCMAETKKRFQDYAERDIRPQRNLQTLIYCNGIRYSENITDWEFLWKEYKKVQDLAAEQVAILSGLACSKDASLLRRLLLKTIDNELEIRAQDAWTVFYLVYTSSSDGVDVAVDFFVEYYREIFNQYKSMIVTGDLLDGVASRVTKDETLDKLKTFLKEAKNLPENFVSIAEGAVRSAERNLQWTKKCRSDVNNYFNTARRKGVSAFLAFSYVVVCALQLCMVVR